MPTNEKIRVLLECPICRKPFERFFEESQKNSSTKEVLLSCDHCGKESLYSIHFKDGGSIILRNT